MSLHISYTKALVVAAIALAMTGFIMLGGQTDAARFQDRSMLIGSPNPSDVTFYQVAFTFPTVTTVGSVKLMFCDSPLPSLPCVVPPGLDITQATLAAQSGETGFSITQQTNDTIVLSRSPSVAGNTVSSYRFDNMQNPSNPTERIYVRLSDYASTNATGAEIDFGSVVAQLTAPVEVYSQVPPILIFCVAETIQDDDCQDANGNFANYGELSSSQARSSTSELLARTNAQYGYSISVTGRTMTAGIHEIPASVLPTESAPGVGQFGFNLVANSQPNVGAAPVGPGTNAVTNADYAQANKYVFRDGDIIVSSTGVTPTRKFTASYIVNIPATQSPGIYSTTLSYLCLAGF